MLNTLVLRTTLAVMVLLTACARPLPAPSEPQPLPSPVADWSMSLTQSGGIAGVMLKVTVSSDGTLIAEDQRSGRTVKQDLTTDTVGRLGSSYPKILLTTPTAPHSGCADCFIYDLRVTAGGREALIHADDTTLAGSGAEDLIRILQGLRDAALRS